MSRIISLILVYKYDYFETCFFFSYDNVCLQYFANSTADVYYKSNWLPCMKDMAVSQAPLYTRIYIRNPKTETHVWPTAVLSDHEILRRLTNQN